MTDDRRGKGSGGDARVPPHNLEAEQSALGAALLSPKGVEALVATTTPGDFYKPAHQHLAEVIRRLFAADLPVDIVTVIEELRRTDTMQLVSGGSEYLLELQAVTPSIGTALRYCRIVKDAAILRRLIGTAAAISDLGYSGHPEPGEMVSRAGELIAEMEVGPVELISSIDFADLAALLASDLQPEQPALLQCTDGSYLLYPGKMHVFQAEPSSGKTWIALIAVLEVLNLGGAVIYLDYEDTATGLVNRLLTLGASTKAIAERFHYGQPIGRHGPAERVHLARLLDSLNPDLVVIDGVGEALSREGLSEDKAEDVLRWMDLLPRPITRTGAAVLMLDHVAKDPEGRGRWARGSGAKLGAIDGASYQIKVKIPFSRHRAGRVDFVVAKDRPGGVGAIGQTVASASFEPHAAGERVTVRLDPRTAENAPTDAWKPTILMGKLSEALQSSTVPLGASSLLTLVHADKPAMVREALSRLIAEGYVAEEKAGRSKVLRLVRPYDKAPPKPAPAWRNEPPAADELDYDVYEPTADEIADIDRQHGRSPAEPE